MESQQRSDEEDRRKQRHDNDAVLFIKESVVRELLSWNDCVDAMEAALVAMSSASSSQTPRSFTRASGGGVLLTMPGYAANYALNTVTGRDERHSTLACKLVTSFAGNAQLNPPLPTILATILLFDSSTGQLKAIVDGTDITAWRTAAVSLVATKHLYPNIRDATLAVLGAGTQVTHSLIIIIVRSVVV
jgi:thiomorpholine-carboxylate dehydrogenase